MKTYETMTTNGEEIRYSSELAAGIVADSINGFVVERMDGTFAVGFHPYALVAE
tara:strand:- start:151 stop:312 length:162 start_codon:yes stop_codon:yes gene_type:complete